VLRTPVDPDALYIEWDALYDAALPRDPDSSDPRFQAVQHEADALGIKLSITEIHTPKALRAKLRVIHREGFEDDNVIVAMLCADDERIEARLAKRRKPVSAGMRPPPPPAPAPPARPPSRSDRRHQTRTKAPASRRGFCFVPREGRAMRVKTGS
jgi:hypothetical protein